MLWPRLKSLVPLSALALLGWCWYAFRRRRRTLEELLLEEESVITPGIQSLKEGSVDQRSASIGNKALIQGLNTDCSLHTQKKQEQDSCSSYSDQNLILEVSDCFYVSSSAKLPNAPTSSPAPRPLKGDRPEPEGEVSEAEAAALLAEKPEMETEKDGVASKGHSDFTAGETKPSCPESDTKTFIQEPPRTVCPKGYELPSLPENPNEKDVERLSYRLVKEAIRVATEEVLANDDDILKRKDQKEPRETLPCEAQTVAQSPRDLNKEESSSMEEKLEESVSSVDYLTDQPMSPSVFRVGEDSGCSTCHSEDGIGADEQRSPLHVESIRTVSPASESKIQDLYHDPARQNGKHLPADASKGTNDVTCMNGEGGVHSRRTAPLPSLATVLWDIEVPSRLVGRLIGKQGKHISFLKQNSGAKIYVSTLPYTHEFQTCHIEGSKLQVENALALIRKKFKDLDLTNRRCHVPSLPSLPITSWLLLPQDSTVEVIVPRVETANYLFVQQHTHPTYYALRSLNEQMLFCYSRPGCPSLPTPVEVGVVCAAPSADGDWWRAQVIQHHKDSNTVQIRYVDYGGYVTVNLSSLRQIRSDFVALPFQGSEVILDNVAPLPGKEEFSLEAKEALEELTQGVPLIIKVTGSRNGLPLAHMWRQAGEEMILVNGLLVERGLCSWLDSH
ncbi:A-kinase anchor protein 1, mitochondrial isoform X1 [Hoplias malabaricus]|uniref:A-kinase anchor protein 1, mitochondrial isoform X1 n=1 Tax=Hoplias malabaricus TaxID=27720 RepID=UPI003462E4E2